MAERGIRSGLGLRPCRGGTAPMYRCRSTCVGTDLQSASLLQICSRFALPLVEIFRLSGDMFIKHRNPPEAQPRNDLASGMSLYREAGRDHKCPEIHCGAVRSTIQRRKMCFQKSVNSRGGIILGVVIFPSTQIAPHHILRCRAAQHFLLGGWKCAIVGVPWRGSVSACLAWGDMVSFIMLSKAQNILSILRRQGTPMRAHLQPPDVYRPLSACM